ncbi:MAG: hypothetical protein HXX12_07990 [Geothrix sp.]|uniref:hypothetical protein n=1 Tax=Geothrix sp. TaxID=1962974 RepID=UPI0017B611FD|nr:hypothetical protein [Geothrix sp.]NWJ40898.1 hypothetical protein [Geothrix sp.]WIL21102.1 MAG: hypothetical protein QOZ81_000348 [Geothrix sp.]
MRTTEQVSPPYMATLASRRADLERFEAQVAEWTALIGQYRASARRVEAQARLELDSITDELQLQRNEASAQVMRLKSSADAEWEHEKSQLERAWQAVRSAFQRAKLKF